ncbi:MAG: NUDIX domain-containing protein, partial [Burkholderiaceae bacterium]
MVRPHTQLHPNQTPATLRPAATVLLLRDGSHGLQVLMTRRSMEASFAPGAYVFPGGAVDPQDHEAATTAGFRREHAPHWKAAALAAIRECYEELGILLAYRADGQPAQASDVARLRREAPFYAQCQALGLRPAADAVWLLAHWMTDRDLPKRFDVPFWVARMPASQEPVADEQEQFEPVWVSPADALQRHAQGAFSMVFPTVRTLQRLQ